MKRTVTQIAEWALTSSSTLGSSVRARGIEREIKRRLPWTSRKCLKVEAGKVTLDIPDAEVAEFDLLSAIVGDTLADITALPVLPSEAEDILAISSRERHKWIDDGRLRSAGTKTVKLRGRAKAVTFHIFDPHFIEHVLDTGLTEIWREEDIAAAAENRRRGAGKAGRTRAGKRPSKTLNAVTKPNDEVPPNLTGWDEFDAEGLLR